MNRKLKAKFDCSIVKIQSLFLFSDSLNQWKYMSADIDRQLARKLPSFDSKKFLDESPKWPGIALGHLCSECWNPLLHLFKTTGGRQYRQRDQRIEEKKARRYVQSEATTASTRNKVFTSPSI
jgi:hypothetical protein